MVKRCFKCGLDKPLSEFYRHPQMADGHLNKCKVCTRRDSLANRAARAGYYRAYDRERASLPERRANASRVIARWKRQHPKRRAAQMALAYAIKTGKIIPWPVCAIPDCAVKPEAHHPDYDQPLDVVWICPPHHKQAHALARAA